MFRYTVVTVALLAIAPAAGLAQTPPPLLVQRSYPVADLVVPLERAATPPDREKDAVPDVSMGPRFVQLIVGTIDPKSWREGGGPGIVEFVPTTKTLVVSQTEAMHQKVAGLLADLRQSQDVLVEVEVRLLTVADSFFERVGIDFNTNLIQVPEHAGHFAEDRPNWSEEDKKSVQVLMMMTAPQEIIQKRLEQTFLDERMLHAVLEAAQGDRRTEVTQGPKITVLNGQTGTVFVGETQFFYMGGEAVRPIPNKGIVYTSRNQPVELGVRVTTQPVVSPDRRLVNLYLKVEEKELGSAPPETVREGVPQRRILSREMEKTLAIPIGQTAVLLGGRRVVEHRSEFGPPLLSKIPYVNRLFKNVAYGRESMAEFVLVTPRIVPLDGRPAPTEAAMKRGYEHLETLAPRSRITDMTNAARGKTEGTSVEAGKTMLRELEPAKPKSDVVAVLQKAYLQARAEGRTEEAEKLAKALLAIDPKIQLQR